ncbi:hypothetical protein [Chryseobacterium wanjuense]
MILKSINEIAVIPPVSGG